MKILYVTTISNTVNTFLIPHIKMLIRQGHQVDVAFNFEQEVSTELIKMGCKIHKLELQRSPLNKGNFLSYKYLHKIIKDEKYDLVHTHTPVASAVTRLACRKLKNVKVYYTAHGFHFYKGSPIQSWLIYYFIEKWLSKYTDVLITINKEDYQRARKLLNAKQVVYIPGVGLDTNKFSVVAEDKLSIREELGFSENDFVVLSIGELNKNKNHETVIRAIAKLNNPNTHYVICGEGILERYLVNVTKELGVEKQVHFLGFRKDIVEICKASDVFAFPSFREGLPVALMEAMATGLPVVCSNIRGNTDLIENDIGGYLVKPNDVNCFAENLEKLKDAGFGMGKNNINKIREFELKSVIDKLGKLYKTQ